MDALLARLERRLGRLAIENLTMFIVGGTALVYVLAMIRPEFLMYLSLDLARVRHGEVWRLVTYLFIPQMGGMLGPIGFFFALYVFWLMGSSLEAEWGSFKFNVFYFVGMIGATMAALITGVAVGNTYLNASVVLAFATMFPNVEFLLFFIIPLRAKWFGWITAAVLAYQCVRVQSWGFTASVFVAVGNYLLFFGGQLWHALVGQGGRRAGFGRSSEGVSRGSFRPPPPTANARKCAICGALESDGADIRVCSCEKCAATGGPRTLCLEHARNH